MSTKGDFRVTWLVIGMLKGQDYGECWAECETPTEAETLKKEYQSRFPTGYFEVMKDNSPAI